MHAPLDPRLEALLEHVYDRRPLESESEGDLWELHMLGLVSRPQVLKTSGAASGGRTVSCAVTDAGRAHVEGRRAEPGLGAG